MPSETMGYVGTVEVEEINRPSIRCSLTKRPDGADWVEIDGKRAWFQMSMEPDEFRSVQFAKLTVLMEAMRQRQQVAIRHPDAPDRAAFARVRGDTWDAQAVRSLRIGITS